jgi:hypothetical protein
MAASTPAGAGPAGLHDLSLPPDTETGDLADVFDAVFHLLPDEVQVRPTGNYLYFTARRGDARLEGNFRLDAADRDAGLVHFAIGDAGAPARYGAFGAADGVKVTRAAPLVYVVHHRGKAVVFRLNDLSAVVPRAIAMRAGETFLGPIEDESGVGFLLLWDEALGLLAYVLDEERAGEMLVAFAGSGNIRIGARTGFAYYRDRYLPRWILVGVRADEAKRNTTFDGPFDQLPENFVRGDALRDALERLDPTARGRIDRFGNTADLTRRVLARPYILYSSDRDLTAYDQCAARARDTDAYYRCFARGMQR